MVGFPSLRTARTGLFEHPIVGHSRALAPELDSLACNPDLVAAAVVLSAVDAERVFVDAPSADLFSPHRVADQRAVALIEVAPVHIVGHFHAGDLSANLAA